MKNKKKLLIVCGSGGHAAEALILYEQIKNHFECSFLLETTDPLTPKRIKNIPVYLSIPVRGKKEPALFIPIRILICFVQAFVTIIKAEPDVVLSTGPGFAGPISLIGKLMGKKIIFIESWSRVNTKSWPGKFIYYFADRFFIQWPSLKRIYPKGIYAGRLG